MLSKNKIKEGVFINKSIYKSFNRIKYTNEEIEDYIKAIDEKNIDLEKIVQKVIIRIVNEYIESNNRKYAE